KQHKDSDTNEVKEAVLTECQRIKLAFKQEVIAVEEERVLKSYFSFHQRGISDLINCCSDILTRKSNSTKAKLLLSEMVGILTNLLQFIRDQFPIYFDLTRNLPEKEISLIRLELGLHAEAILEKFKD